MRSRCLTVQVARAVGAEACPEAEQGRRQEWGTLVPGLHVEQVLCLRLQHPGEEGCRNCDHDHLLV